jgi:hypothetical protein
LMNLYQWREVPRTNEHAREVNPGRSRDETIGTLLVQFNAGPLPALRPIPH